MSDRDVRHPNRGAPKGRFPRSNPRTLVSVLGVGTVLVSALAFSAANWSPAFKFGLLGLLACSSYVVALLSVAFALGGGRHE